MPDGHGQGIVAEICKSRSFAPTAPEPVHLNINNQIRLQALL
jgi:hypothetical protein